MTVCIVLERGDIIMSKSVEPCDPKEYAHLLYERRLYKNGRVENVSDGTRYYFYIKKEASSEEQYVYGLKKYHVALLNTGELVCTNGGWRNKDRADKGLICVGEGVVHHDEYYK